MKRELTQNISHELKTPVSSLQGYLETILANRLPEEKQRKYLERCYAQAHRLSDLLQDISVINRLDNGGEHYERSLVQLHPLLKEIVEESNHELTQKGFSVVLDLPPNAAIRGNYSLLYSIFRNLFDNALAYAGEGVMVAIRCLREDDHFYHFSFSDSGIGVPEEHLSRLFERFYRIDKGRSRKVGGTGLGLSIVKNAVLFHRGQIFAKNRQDGGLEFLFTLKK